MFVSDRRYLLAVLFGSTTVSCLPLFFGAGGQIASIVGVPTLATIAWVLLQERWKKRLNAFRYNDAGRRAISLLAAYEKSGKGWFWETDRHGKIRYISRIVLERIAADIDTVRNFALTDLIAEYGVEDNSETQRTIGFHLSSHTAFSDLHVKVLAGQERWWSLSGSPVFDDLGNFRGFRGSGTDLTDVKDTREKMTRLAKFDVLTELSNRASMNEILHRTLRGRPGTHGNCSVMLLDLDKFKQVNDTLGHQAGDELLKNVAKRLSAVVGDNGKVGRLGGDEFQIILPQKVNRDELMDLAERIIERLSKPYTLSGSQVRIGVSIGIVVVLDEDTTPNEVIRNADLALYAAKDAGRGTARFYEPSLLTKVSEKITLEEELRKALAEDQLFLVYQPIVNVATEGIDGFEVLTRWKHPEKGMVDPEKFIAIAEEVGLIEMIGEWTLRSACAQLAQWEHDLKIAVNVSPRQFRSGNLPQIVMNALAANGLRPEQLELEITESVFLDGDEKDIAIFDQLKRIGVRLALDDFGTGYSALGYLHKAPFDKIKIDQSFVRGATLDNSINDAIISSIVTLAQALGMDTTAEGAERLDELNLVRELGCSHVQGYIYSPPVTEDKVVELLGKPKLEMQANGAEVSREARHRVMHRVRLIHASGEFTGIVRNISSTGAMIEASIALPESSKVIIVFAGSISVEGTVCWSHAWRLGVQFAHGVDYKDIKKRVLSSHQPETLAVANANYGR